MLTVSCRDVGMDCDYVCKDETEEGIMKNAEQHAVQDHHYKAKVSAYVSYEDNH
jgi:predicted small metal-binding protein